MAREEASPLRRGWTTGACAAAAARAAYAALLTGHFPDPVAIRLPRGQTPNFPLALAEQSEGRARAGIVKDAGDDPDVTHGAWIVAELAWAAPRSGVHFRAGEGVGTVTRPGLALAVGEPAINPAPRAMIRETLADLAEAGGAPANHPGPAGDDPRDARRSRRGEWRPLPRPRRDDRDPGRRAPRREDDERQARACRRAVGGWHHPARRA